MDQRGKIGLSGFNPKIIAVIGVIIIGVGIPLISENYTALASVDEAVVGKEYWIKASATLAIPVSDFAHVPPVWIDGAIAVNDGETNRTFFYGDGSEGIWWPPNEVPIGLFVWHVQIKSTTEGNIIFIKNVAQTSLIQDWLRGWI